MKIHKYRAWFDGKMYFVSELMFNSTGVYMATLTNTDTKEIYHYQTNDIRTIELMDYIGKQDKNGKEIYCGDIVEDVTGTWKGEEHRRQWVVFWREKWCGFYMRNIQDPSWLDLTIGGNLGEHKEVIGNVYEPQWSEYAHLLELRAEDDR